MTPRAPRTEGGGAGDLVNEVLPLWPDAEDQAPTIASDGRPWRKACADCAFRVSDPQGLGQHYQREIRASPPGSHYYCIHREDNGCARVCASYAAIRRTRARAATPPAGSAARAGTTEGET